MPKLTTWQRQIAEAICNEQASILIGGQEHDISGGVGYALSMERDSHIPNTLDPGDVCALCCTIDPDGSCRWQAGAQWAQDDEQAIAICADEPPRKPGPVGSGAGGAKVKGEIQKPGKNPHTITLTDEAWTWLAAQGKPVGDVIEELIPGD